MNQLSPIQPQLSLIEEDVVRVEPFKTQLLKWIGNKQRYGAEISSYFPADYGTYYEPFLGSGGVLGTLAPERAVASDVFPPLIEIWQALRDDPETLKDWYAARWSRVAGGDKVEEYEAIKAAYNERPNGADLVFLCRACYGGVVRFRKRDGYMSTPCGAHRPVSPESFSKRVDLWHNRTVGASFIEADFAEAMDRAVAGDMVYCDPPYVDSQAILYGAQEFSFARLLSKIRECKERGVRVALSIDGSSKSGDKVVHLPLPADLFEREVLIDCGRSMLRRFQLTGSTLESEVVADRLLLTY